MKVYGPYTRKDGRKHVIILVGRQKVTISYPKWLMENHLGRKLRPEETVDHIDRDFTNDDINNLRVIHRGNHSSDDARRVKLVPLPCANCGEMIERRPDQLRRASKSGMAGPFCGKSCSGKYGSFVQNGGIKKEPQPYVVSEYYKKVKS